MSRSSDQTFAFDREDTVRYNMVGTETSHIVQLSLQVGGKKLEMVEFSGPIRSPQCVLEAIAEQTMRARKMLYFIGHTERDDEAFQVNSVARIAPSVPRRSVHGDWVC